MRILFVAMSQSIHTARWINQIADEGWDIHLFPSWDLTIHPKLRNLTIHGFTFKPDEIPESVKLNFVTGLNPSIIGRFAQKNKIKKIILLFRLNSLFRLIKGKKEKKIQYDIEEGRLNELVKVIKKIKPDIIHSLEIQHAGYLTLEAKKQIRSNFPTWIVTNWGADIHHFGEISEHAERIRETLENCDYYGCECHRDVDLAKKFGFKGEILPVKTNTGGFDFEYIEKFKSPGKSSDRKLILLKGYQGWVYRSINGLKAIEMCADIIKSKNLKVAVYLASPGVSEFAEGIEKRTGLSIEIIPYTSHEHMLQLHGNARISIGLSLSDAISTSFLEAIVMGSFPIQSCTSCANEWITNGITGFLVPPEDINSIAEAIFTTIIDDDLVDRASEINYSIVKERLEFKKVQDETINTYKKIYSKLPL